MPRIDPQQLLNCLQVLLTPTGGILSKDEVQRLANLMTKFSKKLVSKCIYVLILKNTDKQLLGSFMAEGGWNLIHIWLQDAHLNKNWALVTEVLDLLLITPVDVERLKMNNLPKLVKSLTKRDDLAGVPQLATALVDEWLKIVKDVTKAEAANQAVIKEVEDCHLESIQEQVIEEVSEVAEHMEVDSSDNTSEGAGENTDSTSSSLKFKVALKDGKQVISKVVPSDGDGEIVVPVANNVEVISMDVSAESAKEKKDDKKKEKSNHDRNKHRSSSSSRSSKDKDKERSRDRSKDNSKHSSSKSSSSSRDKDRRDKHRSNSSSSKHKSSKSGSGKDKERDNTDKKENKEKQAEKDKDTLAKIQPHSLLKTGRIPKKNEDPKAGAGKQDEAKKPTFSVEVRKTSEEKPKTVKVFNSKLRSTGLLEEVKPPPPRSTTKKPPPVLPPVIPTKRPSPIRDMIPPPEKKSRLLEGPDRPGAIKLIPPKPKPAVLQESDIFMDALTASATMKKEPKKRKRRPSTSKETSPPTSPSSGTPTSPTTNLKNITPANFYQDTLETENEEEKDKENQATDGENAEIPDTPAEPDEEASQPPMTKTDANGLKGVLCHSKRKGPKRSLRWRPESELVEIQYFELDETERVNVMKPFMDAARMEMTSEREAMRSRKLQNEDVMDTQMTWRLLVEMELPPPQAEPGSKSSEKQIQFAREKRILQAIYFNNRIPDSADEPDPENHPIPSTVPIPLEDPDNPEQEAPLQPWPEPKGSPPHVPNIPPMFPPPITGPPFMNMPGPPGPFPPGAIPPFPPGFMPPNMMVRPGPMPVQPDWNGIPNGMPPPNMPPPDMMNQGPPIFENFGPNMPENGFPPPFQPPPNNNMPMFPPNNFNNNMRGRGGFRRGGNNNGPWVRMAGPNQGWNGPRGGGQNRGGRLCINVKKHGYCRNRDKCHFIHPN